MMPETNPESIAGSFASHVALLRDFFQSRRLNFGEAADLRVMAALLASPGSFYEDMSSMLRTIVFRENMGVTRSELLEVLCVAAGGTHYQQAHPPLDAEIGQLLVFVNVVLLSLRRRTSEAGEAIGDDPEQTSKPPEARQLAPEIPPPMAPLAVLEDASTAALTKERSQPAPLPSDRTTTESAPATAPSALPEEPVASSERPLPRRRPLLSRPAIVAASAVLLVLAVMLLYRGSPARKQTAGPGLSAREGPPAQTPLGPAPVAPAPQANLGPAPAGSDLSADRSVGGAMANSIPVPGSGPGKPAAGTLASETQPANGIQSDETSAAPAATNADVSNLAADTAASVNPQRSPKAVPSRAHDAFSLQHSSRKGLFSVTSGVMSANLLSAPPPEYPVLAKLTRIEGQVILQAVVSRRGTVVATHVLQGHHLLRSAAESCVRKWRYRPYLVDGLPTDVETIVFVKFQLRR